MGKSLKTVVVAARIPPDLNSRIVSLAYNRKVTKTDVILRALILYFENVKKVIGINET